MNSWLGPDRSLVGDYYWVLPQYKQMFKGSDLGSPQGPAKTWVMLDEREDSINDGYFAMDLPAFEKTGIYAVVDYPASYHNGAGVLSFADGHVEQHRWVESTTKPPLLRPGNLPMGSKTTSAHDADMKWLKDRATVKQH